jgi:hypothetical protein
MTAPGPADVYVCIVCAVSETQEDLLATCDGCGNLYHYNPRMTPGKDCGDAWIEDEEIGIQFYCNNCMNSAKREDQDRIEQLKELVNSGGATPDTVAALMQSLGGAFATPAPGPDAASGAYAGFPGFAPGMPGAPASPPGGGVPSMPGMAGLPAVAGMPDGVPAPLVLDPRDMPRSAAEAAASASSEPSRASDPPPLLPRRARGAAPRRYRRIDE